MTEQHPTVHNEWPGDDPHDEVMATGPRIVVAVDDLVQLGTLTLPQTVNLSDLFRHLSKRAASSDLERIVFLRLAEAFTMLGGWFCHLEEVVVTSETADVEAELRAILGLDDPQDEQ